MKSLLSLFTILCVAHCMTFAQSPQAFNYQAVVRNADATVVANQNIQVRVSLLENGAAGNAIYIEQHSVATDALGLFAIQIGGGNLISGDFETINWGSAAHFINIATDLSGGSDFQDLGTFQLLSVPYALYGKDEDADPKNESIESMTLQGNNLIICEANNTQSVDLSSLSGEENTDNQTLNLSGSQLSISGGNSVNLESLQDGVDDADNDPNNEIQRLSFDANTNRLSLSASNSITLPNAQSFWQQQSVGEIFYTGQSASLKSVIGRTSVEMGEDGGQGFLTTYAPNGFPVVHIGNNGIGKGFLGLYGTDNAGFVPPVGIYTDRNNAGGILLSDESDKTKLQLAIDAQGNSNLNMNNDDGRKIDIGTTNMGYTITYGRNGNRNCVLGSLIDFPDNGFVAVVDRNDERRAGIYINESGRGTVFGDIKNFRMEHPTQKGKEIWYASLEGPEAGAYERGTARLIDGEAFVPYSDHFQLVANSATTTFALTPLSAETYGLAVVERNEKGFKVKELAGGNSNFEFTWEVKAVRKGYEDYEVIRDTKAAQPALISNN